MCMLTYIHARQALVLLLTSTTSAFVEDDTIYTVLIKILVKSVHAIKKEGNCTVKWNHMSQVFGYIPGEHVQSQEIKKGEVSMHFVVPANTLRKQVLRRKLH